MSTRNRISAAPGIDRCWFDEGPLLPRTTCRANLGVPAYYGVIGNFIRIRFLGNNIPVGSLKGTCISGLAHGRG